MKFKLKKAGKFVGWMRFEDGKSDPEICYPSYGDKEHWFDQYSWTETDLGTPYVSRGINFDTLHPLVGHDGKGKEIYEGDWVSACFPGHPGEKPVYQDMQVRWCQELNGYQLYDEEGGWRFHDRDKNIELIEEIRNEHTS